MKKDVFEELIVVKRSGQRVSFNSYKIAVAIKNAFDNFNDKYDEKHINKIYEDVLLYIEKTYVDRKTINVEDIQDIIENKLKEEKYSDVYNCFSEYRKKRAASRQVFTIKQQHKFARAMEKIADDNLLKNENSFSPKEIIIKYGKTVVNEFARSYIIDNKYLRAHEEGNIYVHDIESFPLGMLSHTHLMLDDFLENDESFNNLTNIILDSKDEIDGEVNIPEIDKLLENWTLRKFKGYYKENLNNYIRVTGFEGYINLKKIFENIDKESELPFNISNYESVILSSQVKKIFENAYDDALNKLENLLYRKINKMIKRIENNKQNSNFSISFGTNNSYVGTIIKETVIKNLNEFEPLNNLSFIYNVNTLNDKFIDSICELIIGGKNVLLAFVNTSYNKDKEKVEYFANGIRVFDNYNDEKSSKGRMVVGTTSINMARLGLKYENLPKKDLFSKLDEILELVKNELLLTFELISNKSKDNYRVLFNKNILSDEKLESGGKIRKVIKNGNLHIGLVGLKECVQVLCKEEDKQYKLLIEILKYMNSKCEQFMMETKLNFYICEPYKSRSRSAFMALDKAIYGIRKGVTEKSCYDLVSNLGVIKNDYSKLGEIQKFFKGGNMIAMRVPKNTTHKKMMDMIREMYENDVGIVKFVRCET